MVTHSTAILVAKRLASVALEVDLQEYVIQANKTEPNLALKPRGDVTRNPKQGYQCVLQNCQRFQKEHLSVLKFQNHTYK